MQPPDGICPECALPVAESKAAPPVRPAWRDSDPRWRRRMLAGAWVMVLIPLIDVLMWSGLAARIPIIYFDWEGFSLAALDTSFVTWVYVYLVFCIGVALFFSKERGRRRHVLDWTRRWGVFATYLVLLLGMVGYAFLISLVLVGCGALFMSLPHANQPAITEVVIELSAGYINYGPHGSETVDVTLAALSASAILLACFPIYDALRSGGPRILALLVLAPLALASLSQFVHVAIWFLYPSLAGVALPPSFFFQPSRLLLMPDYESFISGRTPSVVSALREAARWLPFLIIAIWLTIAQIRVRRSPPTRQQPAP